MSSFQYRILSVAAFFALTSILLGAMGAHYLAKILSPQELSNIETGTRYQMYHALAMLGLVLLHGKIRTKIVEIVFYLFTTGIVFFSFSLYVFAILGSMDIELPKILFLITPIGGVLLSTGWGLMLYNNIRHIYLRNREKKKS